MTMKHRAYAVLEIKAVRDDERVIEGIASTPSPDRVGDIVEPMGAKFKLPMPLLWQHDSGTPIGHVVSAKPTKDGIPIKATLAKIDEPGPLKDSIDHAWQAIKAGLVRGLSIGFRVIEYSIMEGGGWRITDWDWLELSAVTIPANAEATITNIKKFDTGAPAASGKTVRLSNIPRPASGKPINIISRPKEGQTAMKDVGAQIAALKEQRKEKAEALETIQKTASDAGRTKTAEERKQFDELRDELKTLDAEIADLEDIEALYAPTAKAVEKGADPAPRRTVPATVEKKTAPGIRFAQMIKVRAISQLDIMPMVQVAEKMYGRDSEIVSIIKAGEQVPGANASGNWAAGLVSAEGGIAADFAEWLRPATIIGKFGQGNIPALRNVPFRRPLILGTGGGAGYWVGEGKPKPLTQLDFDRNVLAPLKCATIAVLTMESVRDSSPSSDMIVRDELRRVLAQLEDETFIDPANDADGTSKPPSITYGAAAIASESYSDETDVILDVRSLLQKFIDADNPANQAVFVMREGTALAASLILNALGQRAFPDLGMRGGTLLGIPVITSESVPSGIVVIVNASDIHYGDDGEITVDMSREASLEFKNQAHITQNGIAGTGASLVSLWQNNLVGIRAEHTINWRRRRSSAVAYLTGVAWGGAVNVS